MAELPLSALDARLQRQAENARVALERGNAEYAISIAREILKAHPGALQVRKLLRAAQVRQFQGKNKMFAKAFGSVTSTGFLLANSSLSKKNPAGAIEAAENMLNADPTNVTALRMLATAATNLGLHETAAFSLESVREQQPENLQVLGDLGEAYIQCGEPDKALALGSQMLQIKPSSIEAAELIKHASVAQSLQKGKWEQEGDYRDKLKDEKEAVSLEQAAKVVTSEEMTQRLIQESYERHLKEPENLNHLKGIVEGYRKLGDLGEAVAWLRKARELPAGAADNTLDKLESDLRIEMTENELIEAETQAASDPAAASRVAELKANLALLRLAEAKLLVERYPNEAGYKFTLGQLYVDAGEHDLAIGQFQQAQRNPKYRVQSLGYLGSCFTAKGQFDLAVEQLLQAKNELPNLDETKKDIIYRLGVCYEKMGQAAQAVAEFKLIYSQDIGYRDVAKKIDQFYAQKGG